MGKLVKDIIGECDTGLARGLSLQLLAKVNRMVKNPVVVKISHPLIDTSSLAVNPYLQTSAAEALIRAVEKRGEKLKLNSCMRTTIQQHILRQQYERGSCGITACAIPGRGNHEHARAIDIEDPYDWQGWLETEGWSKLGDWDRMHYDFWDCRNDIAKLQISAFQQLWNQNNSDRVIAVDGAYGYITANCIDNSPVDGW